MYFLPKVVVGSIFIALLLFLPRSAFAVTIASQTQNFPDQLNVWSAIQELGNNLSGTLTNFTFRVSTTQPNLNQFDFTGLNSKIYDKDNSNFSISSCAPAGSSSDPQAGLTFNTAGVPAGFEDVTIDFSCRNYSFITGHRYLIAINNANMAQFGGKRIQFIGAAYGAGGHGGATDLFTGGGLRYSFDNGFCDGRAYIWNSQTNNNGCNIWTSPKDDLYFVLNNNAAPPPPPKLPVVFIPGIGGSELKTSQDIVWSASDGHGGTYSHGYTNNEKIWVNQDEAAKLGDDDYFDVLRLKPDGVTPEATLSLTGNMNPYGYSDIESFFTGMGYVKDNNFFVFNYDWRKDVRSTKDDLDALIESAKTASGQTKVNLVVHSMGGLIARYYISDSTKAIKVNKLIELGVPHLGAASAIKALVYGEPIGRWYFKIINIGVNGKEVKDVIQNFPSQQSLIPSVKYYDFYSNSTDLPYPFRDDRDIDANAVTGTLNYDQTKNLLTNLNYNMTVFGINEQLHNFLDPILNQTNSVKIYEIVGTAQPTLGQLHETWWITWPINLIPKTDEIFINGDDTVPLYSASLKSDSLDISGATKIYYVEQRHGDMPKSDGISMQTVKSILNDDNTLPTDVKDQKISLEGQQITVDDDTTLDIYDNSGNHTGLNSSGDVETNIPKTFYDSTNKTKHIFVKKTAGKVTARVTSLKTVKTKIRIRNYSQDSINKTTFYTDVPITNATPIQFTIDPTITTAPILTAGTQTILATTEATGSAALDQTSPSTKIEISGTKNSSGIYSGPVTITLTGNDSGSGILRIEYSLDNGGTVQTYSNPFIISTPGKTTIQVKSIDKLGNEEIPQTIIIEIAVPPTPTPTPVAATSSSDSGTSSSDSSSSTSNSSVIASPAKPEKQSSTSISSQPSVLGVSFENPNHISDQINVTHILEKPKIDYSAKEILGGLLMVSGGIVTLASLGFIITFLKPFPTKM